MKNISLILNIVLAIAVAVLYFLHFSGAKSSPAAVGNAETTGSTVAYVDLDTLFQYYKYYDEIAGQLKQKGEMAEKQLGARRVELEREIISYQQRAKAGMMSANEMRVEEERLAKKQEELQNLSQSLSSGFMAQEAAKNKELYEKITAFINEYNKEKGFKVIVNYTKSSPAVLYADQTLDITKDVVEGLNKQYESDKASGDKTAEEKK